MKEIFHTSRNPSGVSHRNTDDFVDLMAIEPDTGDPVSKSLFAPCISSSSRPLQPGRPGLTITFLSLGLHEQIRSCGFSPIFHVKCAQRARPRSRAGHAYNIQSDGWATLQECASKDARPSQCIEVRLCIVKRSRQTIPYNSFW